MKNIGTLPGERLAGLSADLFHKVQKGKITLDELDRFLKRKNPFEATSQEDIIYGFYLSVDYGQSLEAMIAAGNYDGKNDNFTAKRFPITGEGVVKFEGRYFHFNRDISSENAIKEIEAADSKNPWSAAKIEQVLSHGKTFPEEQHKFPIIGLGSVAKVNGDRDVPGLYGDGSGRYLDLGWFDGGWDPVFRFLSVRKVSAS